MSKVRTGIMSDAYAKKAFPEYYPLALGSNFQSITLPTHKFTGIKQSLQCKTIARRPILDLHNYAAISAPQNSKDSEQKAIVQYRELIHSAPHTEASYETKIPSINLKLGTDIKEVKIMSVRAESTLKNLVETDQYEELIQQIYPVGFNPKFKLTDGEILQKLVKIYPDEVNTIQSIYDKTLSNTEMPDDAKFTRDEEITDTEDPM